MLMRILADNPGPSFTKHMNTSFVTLVRDLLKRQRDPSVQQIMRETLDAWEIEKARDSNLMLILDMWKNAKQSAPRHHVPENRTMQTGQYQVESTQLPPVNELVGRIEEAKNSAKLLAQLSLSTSPWDFADNDLLKEFSTRCQSAQRNLQGYMNCIPPPDEHLFQTLIETSEQLSVAINKYQRASLAAHRQTSSGNVPSTFAATSAPSVNPLPAPTFTQVNQLQQRPEVPSSNPIYPRVQDPNPFDDANQIHPKPANTYQASPRNYESYTANIPTGLNRSPSPATGAIELPLTRTPPPIPHHTPPTATFPSRSPVQTAYANAVEDLYSPAPQPARHQDHQNYRPPLPASPPPSAPRSQLAPPPPRHELQGTPSYYARQDVASKEIVMSGAMAVPHAHHAELSDDLATPLGERNTAGGRLRDDDPVSPMVDGGRGGWRTWGS